MRKLRALPALLALLALAALLAGCALPPYSEELSLAQVTRSKLGTPVNRIGPVYVFLDDKSMENKFFFLPDRDDPDNSGGFLVSEASYGLRIWYLAGYSSYGSLNASWAISLENASETANNYLLQPIKSSSGFDLSLVRYLPSSGYLENDLIVLSFTDPYTFDSPPATPALRLADFFGSTYPPTVIAAGSSVFPMGSLSMTYAYDLQYFLCYAVESGTYVEVEYLTSESSGAEPSVWASSDFTLSVLPADLRNAFYGHEMNTGQSYLSYWSAADRRYKSYSWTSTTLGPPAIDPPDLKLLSGIDERIDAVLTNGQLLSFADNSCTVYSSTGKKLYKFPLGSLKFCFERWDAVDTRSELYFTLTYWQYGREEKPDQLFIEVYAIPTASLGGLD
jgi:hypothetical protein